jgi:small nuclear ribonucleoprotein (snRNP)-like protein
MTYSLLEIKDRIEILQTNYFANAANMRAQLCQKRLRVKRNEQRELIAELHYLDELMTIKIEDRKEEEILTVGLKQSA